MQTIITQLKDISFEAFRKAIGSVDQNSTGSIIENINCKRNFVKKNSTQSFPSVESLHTGKGLILYICWKYEILLSIHCYSEASLLKLPFQKVSSKESSKYI